VIITLSLGQIMAHLCASRVSTISFRLGDSSSTSRPADPVKSVATVTYSLPQALIQQMIRSALSGGIREV
jgi:hypothetical protein